MAEAVLTIGIASYNSPEKLRKTIDLLVANTTGEWKIQVIDNNSTDQGVRSVLEAAQTDPRISVEFRTDNVGYVGAVNGILASSDTDYVAYCDNDAYVYTHGWNERFQSVFDNNPQVAMAGPAGYGAYNIDRGSFVECQWTIGCFWMMRTEAYEKIGPFDPTLGHQEECDYALRLRMGGWKLATVPDVQVRHDATSSVNPEAQERISAGVVRFVNKWTKYFTGELVNYDSENVLRWEDWHPNALYIEQWMKTQLPSDWNTDPEVRLIEGRPYVILKVPRAAWGTEGSSSYRGRII